MRLNDPTVSEGERGPYLQSIGLFVCSCLSVAVGACLVVGPLGHGGSIAACTSERINPNTAPVGSLIRLPGIGLTRAHAIAVHREVMRQEAADGIAFRVSEDLQRIKGIGPKTVADVADWLAFDSPMSEGLAHLDRK